MLRRRHAHTRDDMIRRTLWEDVQPIAFDQYRTLALALQRGSTSNGARTILITSALPGEGKSLTVVNLGVTLSTSYRHRVLLIDADLRRPCLLALAERTSEPATQPEPALSDAVTLPVAVKQLTPTLSVVAAAGLAIDDPVEVLSSPAMRELIEWARRSFDWVLVDTPPAVLVPDANILAPSTDGVLLVVRAGVTGFEVVQRAAAALGRERILGVVLNRVQPYMAYSSAAYYADYGYYDRSAKETRSDATSR